MPRTLPSVQERTRRLKVLQAFTPVLVYLYKLSCLAYCASGGFYLWRLPHLPPAYRSTPLCSGPLMALLLILQGCCSFTHDALYTFGRRSFLGLPLGPWLSWADRALATTLTFNAVGLALTWPPGHTAIAAAMVASLLLTFPTSRYYELTGDMQPFLVWHSLWHYLPNLFAILWLGLASGLGEGSSRAGIQ